MTAIELNTGAIKLHRDRYDDTTESTLVNILWACEERDTYLIGERGTSTHTAALRRTPCTISALTSAILSTRAILNA